jgi:hypothetical protein
MNLFPEPLNAERLLRVFQVVAVVAGLLAVAGLIGKDVTNRIVADRKTKEILALQKDVADARTKQAEAERKLELLRRRRLSRIVSDTFREALKNKPVGQAVVLYVVESSEIILFADDVHEALNDAGWQVPPPKQISSVSDLMGGATSSGEIVVLYKLPYGVRHTPGHVQALYDALQKERFRVEMRYGIGYPLPDDFVHIIINPRRTSGDS